MSDPFSDRRQGEFRGDRRRPGWRDFRRQYPGFIFTMALAFFIMLAIDGWLVYRRQAYSAEITRLRANMSDAEREKSDLLIESERNKIRVAIELVRRQARMDNRLHLSIPVDSGRVYLERDGAILREIAAQLGPEKVVGEPPDTIRLVIPRGERMVQRIMDNESWTAPEWVYADRGVPAAQEREVRGGLGPVALMLDDGTVIYTTPSVGPLADSVYVLPGSVRVAEPDLRAVLPNVEPGMKVYFY